MESWYAFAKGKAIYKYTTEIVYIDDELIVKENLKYTTFFYHLSQSLLR